MTNTDPTLVRISEHPKLGPLYACYAKAKSSVCFNIKGSKKRTLLLEIAPTKCKNHAKLASPLMVLACKKSFTKEQAVAWRAKQY